MLVRYTNDRGISVLNKIVRKVKNIDESYTEKVITKAYRYTNGQLKKIL